MSNYSKPLAAKLSRDERGQMAVIMVMVLPVIFLFFAMALDAGLWFFDHRLAQNQADAAALAAAQHLPAVEFSAAHIDAETAVETWVIKNGSNPGELDCGDGSPSPEFRDFHPASNPDGKLDWVRVCVRRESPGIFSGLAGLNFIYVSAAATARVGPVGSIANVMPWGLVPPDPTCSTTAGDPCQIDTDGDDIPDTNCGYFPPIPEGEKMCPWGLDEDKLFVFKPGDVSADDVYTPGNFGPISACGGGAVEYNNCIEGKLATGFYAEGETVNVSTLTGDLGANTPMSLDDRYAGEAAAGYPCDVQSEPDRITGLDYNGKRRAAARYVADREPWIDPIYTTETFDFRSGCDFRLVSIPILNAFPPQGASAEILVLGVATFAIAGWDRDPQFGNAVGKSDYKCDDPPPGPPPGPDDYYDCGYVWGYLIADAFPPDVLVNSISNSANPFAPLLIAMVE